VMASSQQPPSVKIKPLRRAGVARRVIDFFTPAECINAVATAGYDAW
jgi:hypothetical protein